MKAPSAAELAVQYAIKAERLEMLRRAQEAKDLQEVIDYLESLLRA